LTYESEVNAIIAELVTRLKEITDFGDRVYYGYRVSQKAFPVALLHLHEDVTVDDAIHQRDHRIAFNLLIRNRADIQADSELEMDNFIALVGKVHDKLDGYISNPPKWRRLNIERTTYTFGQERNYIFYSALIRISLSKRW